MDDSPTDRPPRGRAALGWASRARDHRIARTAFTYAVAAAGGIVASRTGIPLPWMLGPFFATAALSASGVRLDFVPMSRELGQVAVGLAIGVRFTPPVLAVTLSLLPAMIAATLYTIAFTLLAAFLLRPLAKVDPETAFFATAAGGMADMAAVAGERGGDPNAVAIVHALRVATVVSVVPFIVVAFGERGIVAPVEVGASHDLLYLAAALALAYASAVLLKPTPIPNPWLLGPIFFGAALAVSGLPIVAVPGLLIVAAQIMIGAWLGCRFKREILVTLPRVAAAGFAISLFMIAAAALGASVLAEATGLPFSTSFLSLAPAAVTEMAITAAAMNVDAELVTAFHVMRIAVISSTVLLVHRIFKLIPRAWHGSGA